MQCIQKAHPLAGNTACSFQATHLQVNYTLWWQICACDCMQCGNKMSTGETSLTTMYIVGIISCVSHPQSKLSYHSFMVPCLQLKILIIWTSFSVQPTATKCLVVLHLSNSFCKLRHLWQSTKQSQVTGKIWWLKWEEGCVVKHEHSIHKCVHTVPNGSIVSSVHRYVCTMPQVLHVFMRGAILLTELSVVIFGLFFSESTSMYMYAVIHYHVCWSVGMVGVSEIQLEYMPWWWCKLYYYISVDIMQDNTT